MSLRVNLSSQTFFRDPAAEIEKIMAQGAAQRAKAAKRGDD